MAETNEAGNTGEQGKAENDAKATGGEGAKPTFTPEQQAYLNELMGKVREEGKATAEKYFKAEAEKKAEAERIAKLQGEEKIKAEYEAKQRASDEQLATITRQLREAEARSELASAGISSAFISAVVGKTAEETKANVSALRTLIDKEVAAKFAAGAAKGAPNQPTGGQGDKSESDKIKAIVNKGMGLNPKE